MNKAAKLLRTISLLNWLFVWVLGFAALALAVILSIFWLELHSGTDAGKILLEIAQKPEYQDIISAKKNIALFLETGLLAFECLFNAWIFMALANFLGAKSAGKSLALQNQILMRVPAYLVAAYAASVLVLLAFPDRGTTSVVITVLEALIPHFEGPLALVFAGVIYLFQKTLLQQSELSNQVSQLKEEAELVI